MADGEKWLSSKQAAEFLKISLQTLFNRRAMRRGPPAYRIGRIVRYKREDLEQWLETEGELAQEKRDFSGEIAKLQKVEVMLRREEKFLERLELQRQKVEEARRRRDEMRKQIEKTKKEKLA